MYCIYTNAKVSSKKIGPAAPLGFWSAQYLQSIKPTPRNRVAEFQQKRKTNSLETMDSNRFGGLMDGVEEHELQHTNSNNNSDSVQKISKPPPIVVYNINIEKLMKKIKNNTQTKDNVMYKILHNSIQVICQNESDYDIIKNYCDAKSIEYSSHPLKGDKNVKVCLFGLPNIPTNDLKDELNSYNVKPFDIKVMTPKKEYGGGCKIYLLFFKRKDNIKLQQLKDITGLFNIRVKWEYYAPKRHAPTQCSRCQSFGHGSANCKKLFKCVSCGGDHDSKVCTKRKPVQATDPNSPTPAKPRVPDNEVCCANCGANHTANYSKCAVRIQYQERIQKAREKNKNTSPTFINNLQQFPNLPQPNPNAKYMQQHFARKQQSIPDNRQLYEQQQQQMFASLLQSQQQLMMSMVSTMFEQMMSKMELMITQILNKFNINTTQND